MTSTLLQKVSFVLILTLMCGVEVANAGDKPEILQNVGFEQRLGEKIPFDLIFSDHQGKPVRLGEIPKGRPVILVPAYYECPMLCDLIHQGLIKALKPLRLEVGKDFRVATVSFLASETPELAARARDRYLKLFEIKVPSGWYFLTGEPQTVDPLLRVIGFRYAYDPKSKTYAHPSGIVVLTPDGKISKYFYGVEFSSKDLRLALVEASAGKIGSVIDHVLLFCYQYDPSKGTYGIAIFRLLRIAGILTVLSILGVIVYFLRKEKKRRVIG